MSKADSITKEIADNSLSYNPETGIFLWKPKGKSMNAYHGREAGTMDKGYVFINIQRVKYPAHRLAWLMTHGTLPSKEYVIDHINHDRADNRIENLRVISYQHNSANTVKARTTSKTGVIGVSFICGKYYARTTAPDGSFKYLGCHATLEAASAAYAEEKARVYPGLVKAI